MPDRLTEGPLTPVGSSMGGWIMCLLACTRPGRVARLVGVTAAADFTTRLIELALDVAQHRTLEAEGRVLLPACHADAPGTISRALIADRRRHAVRTAPLTANGPVRLIHGTADKDVP